MDPSAIVTRLAGIRRRAAGSDAERRAPAPQPARRRAIMQSIPRRRGVPR